MEPIATEVQDAIAARDWASVRGLLHPYLHWTDADGRVIRGRRTVLAMLEETDPPKRPAGIELRDGQIYRWTCR